MAKTDASMDDIPKIPRPMNPWILFRKEWCKTHMHLLGGKNMQEISKAASLVWNNLGAKKVYWERRALGEMVEHDRKYPGYKFNPQKGVARDASKGEKKRVNEDKSQEANEARKKRRRVDETVKASVMETPASLRPEANPKSSLVHSKGSFSCGNAIQESPSSLFGSPNYQFTFIMESSPTDGMENVNYGNITLEGDSNTIKLREGREPSYTDIHFAQDAYATATYEAPTPSSRHRSHMLHSQHRQLL